MSSSISEARGRLDDLPLHVSDALPVPRRPTFVVSVEWMVQHAVPLAGVLGAALYGVLRLSYVFFYLQLRATPEEVGYGYVQILAGQLVGALELVLLVTVVFFCSTLLVRSASRLLGSLLHRHRVRSRTTGSPVLVTMALRSAGAALGIVLLGLPVVAWAEGSLAVQGYAVRNVYLIGSIRLPVLAVAAVPAIVTEADTDPNRPGSIGSRGCLLYLGRADGQAVFYDVSTHESLRLPSDSIVISLQNTSELPLGC
ncbi:hypothetical protein E0H73_45475 [Kribbella pittospori]|uniref:Uncharacterized protein n=1 Tax=Kribbella pittospori TaxID=722689 RepID=A0A4R0JGK9_9ACTN|nr:hypothetical protein [Kribbella pittospori]TCC44774.1 hypothetical protein E0H73_45475 [Kribbella pittospori]